MTLLITVLVLGMLGSLSPSTIVVFILLLATTRARVNAAAFLIGWSISLIAVFALAYFAGGAHSFIRAAGTPPSRSSRSCSVWASSLWAPGDGLAYPNEKVAL